MRIGRCISVWIVKWIDHTSDTFEVVTQLFEARLLAWYPSDSNENDVDGAIVIPGGVWGMFHPVNGGESIEFSSLRSIRQ